LRSGFIFILFGKKGAMMSEINLENHSPELESLCNEFRANNQIPPEKFDLYQVKRGLRNPDGTGVMAGLTLICNVHGYLIDDGELVPDVGKTYLPRH
jgi:citrate synthase